MSIGILDQITADLLAAVSILTSNMHVQVAACICLFALDKHEAIPVDTHVWQLAVRYYTPHLKGETPNVLVGAPTHVLSQELFGTE